MSLYLCSDLHLGHRLMERVRPFSTIEEHDQHIAECWRRVVDKDDVVICLGDMAFNRRGLEILRNLPGCKKLVMGNHDNKKITTYLEIFKSIRAYRILDGDILLAHMPIHPMSLFPRYRAQIHGHIHDREHEWIEGSELGDNPVGGRYLNICPEVVGYASLRYERVLEMLPPRRNPPVFAC